MKIAVDVRWSGGGIGRFCREVMLRLSSQGVQVVPIVPWGKAASPLAPLLIRGALSRTDADAFWSPGFIPPWRPMVPSIICVHDLIHRKYGSRWKRLYYDTVIRRLAKRMACIVTVSEYSKADIISWMGQRHPPVYVVGSGVSRVFVPNGARLELGAPYVLYSGARRAHKNLHRLVEAFGRAHGSTRVLLAMTGLPDERLGALARRLGLSDRVRWLGWLDEQQLASAYRGAAALVLVSLAEGFGLPVVEAMACGTPVVCSATTSLGEVAGDAAYLVDPEDVASIAAGLDRVVADEDLRKELRKRGLARASLYSWDHVATRVLAVLREVTGR